MRPGICLSSLLAVPLCLSSLLPLSFLSPSSLLPLSFLSPSSLPPPLLSSPVSPLFPPPPLPFPLLLLLLLPHDVEGLCSVLALYSYTADNADELTFHKGSVITVLSKDADAGWWLGELDNKKGLFPSNYVQTLDDQLPLPSSRCECVCVCLLLYLLLLNCHSFLSHSSPKRFHLTHRSHHLTPHSHTTSLLILTSSHPHPHTHLTCHFHHLTQFHLSHLHNYALHT